MWQHGHGGAQRPELQSARLIHTGHTCTATLFLCCRPLINTCRGGFGAHVVDAAGANGADPKGARHPRRCVTNAHARPCARRGRPTLLAVM